MCVNSVYVTHAVDSLLCFVFSLNFRKIENEDIPQVFLVKSTHARICASTHTQFQNHWRMGNKHCQFAPLVFLYLKN